MKRLILCLCFLGIVFFPLMAQTLSGEALLEAIDQNMSFQENDYSSELIMMTDDPETGRDSQRMNMFRRDKEEKFLMLIREPAVKKGQGYLRIGDNLWFYDPESRRTTRSSMKEHFEGGVAKNGDFKDSSFAEDYRILQFETTKLGAYEVYYLELEGIHDEVPYPYSNIWVEKNHLLLLKSQDMSLTKRLMRTSLYLNYAKLGASFVPKRMIFQDELVEGRRSEILLEKMSLKTLPDFLFQKDYLEKVSR